MRADQPGVSAASWMVSASTRHNLIKVVSRFARRGDDALAALVRRLVEADHRLDRVVGGDEAVDDLARLHLVIALPGRVDVELGARRGRALALDGRLGL